MNIKKYIVLGVLFILPITVYLFFASGVNHFAKLPILSEEVTEVNSFKTLDGNSVSLENHITVLGFFGASVDAKKANAFNLAHKIYKKNYEFEDFQFVILVTEDQREAVLQLKEELRQIADPSKFIFAIGNTQAISDVFNSLQTNGTLDASFASNRVYLIDKEGHLRVEPMMRIMGFYMALMRVIMPKSIIKWAMM